MVIYKITNIVTQDFYIGKTINSLKRRMYQHIYDAFSKNSQTHLHRSIRKYGTENFSIEIIDTVDSYQLLNEKEIYWIQKLSPKYNMTKGGDGGDVSKSPNYIESLKNKNYKHSEESKEKIRMAHLGKPKPPLSEERKNKISESNKGRKHAPRSAEWKEKQSLAHRGKKRKPFTEEHKQKLKDAKARKRLESSNIT